MSEDLAKSIYLGIGSNLGNKRKNIEKSKFNLIANNIKILKCSSYYESFSWPDPNNPKFLNIVLEIETYFSPLELFRKCKKIEEKLGRKKLPKNSPRECDIDIIDFRNMKTTGELILPHPRMNTRIASYKQASYSNHKPLDNRKLLLNKKEINKLIGKIQRDGLTIIPTKMYFKKGIAKLELAVAKGKKQYDKRATKKNRDWSREKARYVRRSS
jgi:SsrA-binding protein